MPRSSRISDVYSERCRSMDRRRFSTTVAGAIAGAALGARPLRALERLRTQAPTLDTARINANLKALSAFGANPQGGVSRTAYSDADRAGRAWVMERMRAAALDVSVDFAGNIVGRRA